MLRQIEKFMRSFTRLKFVLILIIFLSTFSFTFYIFKNFKGKKVNLKVKNVDIACDLKMREVHLVERKRDRKEWELNANSTEFFDSQKTTHLERVKLIFYPENRKEITITGDKGKFHNATKDMEIYGNVVVSSEDGYSLKTDSLKWIASAKAVETDDPVEIVSDNLLVKGKGLFSESEKNSVKIKSNVSATLYNIDLLNGSKN
jgi:LPS export ABC transporter protein LptC